MGKFGERKIRFGEKIRKIIIKMWKLAKKKVATLHSCRLAVCSVKATLVNFLSNCRVRVSEVSSNICS